MQKNVIKPRAWLYPPFFFLFNLNISVQHSTTAPWPAPGSLTLLQFFNLDMFIQNVHESAYYSTYMNWFLHIKVSSLNIVYTSLMYIDVNIEDLNCLRRVCTLIFK